MPLLTVSFTRARVGSAPLLAPQIRSLLLCQWALSRWCLPVSSRETGAAIPVQFGH